MLGQVVRKLVSSRPQVTLVHVGVPKVPLPKIPLLMFSAAYLHGGVGGFWKGFRRILMSSISKKYEPLQVIRMVSGAIEVAIIVVN